MIRSLPLTALSLLLGFFFLFVGLIKITPRVNADIYRDMKNEFGRFNKVFPLYKYTEWRPYAKNYRLAIGITEVICGSLLILIPGPAKELASFVLLGIMSGAFYTHWALNDSFERMAPSLVFGLLIICRLIILYQVNRREAQEIELFRRIVEAKLEKEKSKDNQDNDEQDGGEDDDDDDEKNGADTPNVKLTKSQSKAVHSKEEKKRK